MRRYLYVLYMSILLFLLASCGYYETPMGVWIIRMILKKLMLKKSMKVKLKLKLISL
jgi:hypothetical protein